LKWRIKGNITFNYGTSTSAEAFVAYAYAGDFACEIHDFKCNEKDICYFRKLLEPMKPGRANFLVAATAKD